MTRAVWLAVPLVAALLAGFVLPVAMLLSGAVRDDAVSAVLPRTIQSLRDWRGDAPPPDAAYAALAADLLAARATAGLATAAGRLNLDRPGLRSTLLATARTLPPAKLDDPRATMLAVDPAWADVETWGAIRRAAGPLSDFQLLAALDLKRDAAGTIRQAPEDRVQFRAVILRSVLIAGSVTIAALLLGYPAASLIATSPRGAGPLLLCVLVPFWASLLVRTAAWMALLSRAGVVNKTLLSLGLIGAPLDLLHHRYAVVIAMVNMLLPYMILPLVAAMRAVPAVTMRAAASLGASPLTAFRRVWLPQTYTGIAAGTLLVFVQALGAYVTPALIGGASDQMLPWFIGVYARHSADWGLAASLALVLLAAIALLVLAGRRCAAGLLSLR